MHRSSLSRMTLRILTIFLVLILNFGHILSFHAGMRHHCCYILLTFRTSLSLNYSHCFLAANSIFVHKLRFMTSPGRWYKNSHWRWSWHADFAIHKTLFRWKFVDENHSGNMFTFISRHSMIRMPLYVSIHTKHDNFDICKIFSRYKFPYKSEGFIKKNWIYEC